MNKLIDPSKESIIYEDKKLYACLAAFPIANGHVIVAWKKPKRDLHLLPRMDYEYLMDKVDIVRTALLKALNVEKVYLLYMDEIEQVHWHLVPRYIEKGLNVLTHDPKEITDFSLAREIRKFI